MDLEGLCYEPAQLFRCCIRSLHEQWALFDRIPADGTEILCRFCFGRLILTHGHWEWARP